MPRSVGPPVAGADSSPAAPWARPSHRRLPPRRCSDDTPYQAVGDITSGRDTPGIRTRSGLPLGRCTDPCIYQAVGDARRERWAPGIRAGHEREPLVRRAECGSGGQGDRERPHGDRSVEEGEVALGDHPGRQGVLDEAGLAAARQLAGAAVQPARAGIRELLADVVELAVELGDGPAEPLGGIGRARDLAGAGVRAAQEPLAEGDDEQLLVGRHRDPADRGLGPGVLGLELGGGLDRDERGVGEHDVEVVGRGTRGEPHGERLERQRDARAGREPGLEEPLLVGDRRGEGGADVAQPPQVVLAVQVQEDPVQVGVVVDLDVGDPADRQRSVVGGGELLAAELDGGSHVVSLPGAWMPVSRRSGNGSPIVARSAPTCATRRPARRPARRSPARTVCRGSPCTVVTVWSTTAASLSATRSWKKSSSSTPT